MPARAARIVHFTKAIISQLRPPVGQRLYVFDDECRGLALCLTPAGSRTWYLVRRVDTKVERVRLGKWPALTVENARKKAEGHNGKQATEGINPNEKRRRERNAPTLRTTFDQYIAGPARGKRKRPRSAKTTKDYRWQFDKHLASWQDRKLSSITKADVEKLHAALGEEHGLYMANRVLALLKALFTYAMDQDYYPINPARKVLPFEEQSRDTRLDAEDMPAFWQAVEAEPDADFFKLALLTGARQGNVISARWEDIDFRSATWRIPTTKSGKPLTVPLTPTVLDMLRARRKQVTGYWVFPNADDTAPMPVPKHGWNRIREATGLPDLRMHDLRRSFASWQASAGTNTTTIGKSLGHASVEATKIYAHADLEAVRKSVETATAAILAAAGKGVANG